MDALEDYYLSVAGGGRGLDVRDLAGSPGNGAPASRHTTRDSGSGEDDDSDMDGPLRLRHFRFPPRRRRGAASPPPPPASAPRRRSSPGRRARSPARSHGRGSDRSPHRGAHTGFYTPSPHRAQSRRVVDPRGTRSAVRARLGTARKADRVRTPAASAPDSPARRMQRLSGRVSALEVSFRCGDVVMRRCTAHGKGATSALTKVRCAPPASGPSCRAMRRCRRARLQTTTRIQQARTRRHPSVGEGSGPSPRRLAHRRRASRARALLGTPAIAG